MSRVAKAVLTQSSTCQLCCLRPHSPASARRSVKAAPWTRSCRGGSSNLNSSFEASNSPPTTRFPDEPRSDCPLRIHRRRPNEPYLATSSSRLYHTKLAMDHRPQAWGRVCHPHPGALAACFPPMNPIRTRSLTRIEPPHSPETISTAPMMAPTSTTAGPSRPRSHPSLPAPRSSASSSRTASSLPPTI